MNAEERLARLPAGRHGLPPEVVRANQRDRLIDAFARVVVEKGFRATTVHDITSTASVSRNVFYEEFGGKDECFIAVYEVVRGHIRALILKTAEPYPDQPEKLVAALQALLGYFSRHPDLARLCLVEPLSAGPAMTEHHEKALAALVERLGAMVGAATDEGSARNDEVLILGGIALVARRINLGEADKLEELLPELAGILLSPRLDEERVGSIVQKVREGTLNRT